VVLWRESISFQVFQPDMHELAAHLARVFVVRGSLDIGKQRKFAVAIARQDDDWLNRGFLWRNFQSSEFFICHVFLSPHVI
jgi:hypothetical protein